MEFDASFFSISSLQFGVKQKVVGNPCVTKEISIVLL
jgi:hypothetical protein